jgi:transmembrane 9 superfamily protein 2/4
VNFKVNSLTSDKTALPLGYYSLPFCQPPRIVSSAENLGEVLRGDRIFNSLYQAQTGLDENCKVACRVTGLTKAQTTTLHGAISDEYRVNMILDNLPAAVRNDFVDEETGVSKSTYERGFPIGFKTAARGTSDTSKPSSLFKAKKRRTRSKDSDKGGSFFVNNHLRFTVLVHSDFGTDKMSRIVGFEVAPLSVHHAYGTWNDVDPALKSCTERNHPSVTIDAESRKTTERDENTIPPQQVTVGTEIVFTYDIVFKESPIKWASRWDVYLQMAAGAGVHWFSVVNSCLVVVFLSAMVAAILTKTLKADIQKYNLRDLVSAFPIEHAPPH